MTGYPSLPASNTPTAALSGRRTTRAATSPRRPTQVSTRRGSMPTTRYTWDQRWDNVTESIAPTGEVPFRLRPANGNRLWQEEAGRAEPGEPRVYASGNGAGLVKTVTDPTGRQGLRGLDVRGNLVFSRTPLGTSPPAS